MSVTVIVLVVLVLTVTSTAAQPTVTLSHGGKLQGQSETFQGKSIDVFLGKKINICNQERRFTTVTFLQKTSLREPAVPLLHTLYFYKLKCLREYAYASQQFLLK